MADLTSAELQDDHDAGIVHDIDGRCAVCRAYLAAFQRLAAHDVTGAWPWEPPPDDPPDVSTSRTLLVAVDGGTVTIASARTPREILMRLTRSTTAALAADLWRAAR